MPQERLIPPLFDWEKIIWEQTPYSGVFLHKTEEKLDPSNPSIPLHTIMALKIEPKAKIPLHKHKREPGWTETIVLSNGGKFEIRSDQELKKIKTTDSFTIVIKSGEVFGIRNMDPLKPLYFFSTMKPGFTGYGEIEEVKAE